jgi:hypothetical protein
MTSATYNTHRTIKIPKTEKCVSKRNHGHKWLFWIHFCWPHMASANWRMFCELQTLKNLYMKKSCKNQSSSYTRISFLTVPFPWSCAIWSLPSHLLHPIANTNWTPEPTFRHTEVSSYKTDTFKKCYWKMQMAPAPKSGGPNSVCFTKSCWALMCQEWRRNTALKLFFCTVACSPVDHHW